MPEALVVLCLCAALLLEATLRAAACRPRPPVVFAYPNSVELAGRGKSGRVRFDTGQWVREPGSGAACLLVVHLPGGDLGGKELCHFNGPQVAVELGAGNGFDLFRFHGPAGDVIGLRVGLIPGGRPFEVGINGVRVRLPLSEADAVTGLGEPASRTTLRP
ncbi:hypothetical protein [Gemmata sp.]|uniref:hypothetical protein n=1 Tax=Gemmata sp. TaxID=1914242 RepID=UPI003F71AA6E